MLSTRSPFFFALRLLISTLLVATLASCSSEDDNSGESCERRSDCSTEGHQCIDRRCTFACVEDIDCSDGLVCTDFVCAPPIEKCRADEDCRYAHECVQGICAEIEDFCLRNSDCQSGFICDETIERCIEANSNVECTNAGDCFAGEICINAMCEPEPDEDECAVNGDCFAGEICVQGSCVTEPEPDCVRNSDCRDDLVCREGECVAECVADRDCQANNFCDDGMCEPLPSTSNGTTSTSNGTTMPPDNRYSGQFRLSSGAGIQRCNEFISVQYEARDVTANQNDAAYTFIFPTSTYDGSINGINFNVTWSGFQQTTAACGDMNTANTYNGTFRDEDFFQATLTSEFFFQVRSCNCTLVYPITGTRR